MTDETEKTEVETETPEAASPSAAPASQEPETGQSTDSSQGASDDDVVSGSDGASEPAGAKGSPREQRTAARAAKKAAEASSRPARTAEERQADRDAARASAATARRAARAKAGAKHKSEAHNRTATPPREHVAGRQKVRQGIVVSDKADKTITVRIDVARRHPKYEKIVRTSTTFHAHDESNDAHVGDTVTIRESRPLSRSKRWRLVGVVERAK